MNFKAVIMLPSDKKILLPGLLLCPEARWEYLNIYIEFGFYLWLNIFSNILLQLINILLKFGNYTNTTMEHQKLAFGSKI